VVVVPTHLQKLDLPIGSISTVEVENKKYLKAQTHVLLEISIPTPSFTTISYTHVSSRAVSFVFTGLNHFATIIFSGNVQWCTTPKIWSRQGFLSTSF